jgi:outer membrane protein assembly factor BamE (lipoprotein component of BamABCDE complex)
MKTLVRYSIYSHILFAVCFLTSCSNGQVGRNFQLSDVSRIEAGKTTKTEVLEFFGEPFTAIEVAKWKYSRVYFGDEDAVLIWRYRYESGSLIVFSAKSMVKSMQVEFDAAGRVMDYYCESTFPEDTAPKSPTTSNFDLFKARDQIRAGKTTRDDVIAILGGNYISTAFNKPGVAERWHYGYSENLQTYSKSLDVFFDSNGTVLHCKGESDFPDDLTHK